MLSGQAAIDRPDVDSLNPSVGFWPVAQPVPGQPRRRERRAALVAAAKQMRRARIRPDLYKGLYS